MKRKLRSCSRGLGAVLALMTVAAVGCIYAGQNESAGQNGGQQDPEAGNGELGLPHLERDCRLLPAGGVCLKVGDGKVELLHVQANVYMIAGAGGNMTVQVGDQVVMVVDAGTAQMSDKVIAAIRMLTSKPIFFVVDTSADPDHTGGNEKLSQAGWALPNGSGNPLGQAALERHVLPGTLPPGASILSHINVLNRMSAPTGQVAPTPQGAWPTDTYETDEWRLHNGEAVYLYHVPAAHTDGDSIVLFRGSDVVSTGDIFTMTSYPVIEADKDGSIDGIVDGLNQIIELLEPKENEEGGTYVIPGHGRICDRNDVVNYRDMVTIIRGRIDTMMKKGMTLDQVKAAKPTLDYDVLFGATSGPWTTDMFIEAIYRDLSKGKKQQGETEPETGRQG